MIAVAAHVENQEIGGRRTRIPGVAVAHRFERAVGSAFAHQSVMGGVIEDLQHEDAHEAFERKKHGRHPPPEIRKRRVSRRHDDRIA